MATKLNVPNVSGLNTEGFPFGVTVFLQAVQDALNVIDRNTVYKDGVTVNIAAPKLRALNAQGAAFSVSGTSLASGDDYARLVADVRTILDDHNALRSEVASLTKQLQGS